MKKRSCVYLIAAMLKLIGLTSCSKESTAVKSDTDDPSLSVLTDEELKLISFDTTKAVNQESSLMLTGKVTFNGDLVTQVFPLVSGQVQSVYVMLGDKVKKGEELAVLRSPEINDLQNRYRIALSGEDLAKKDLDIAEQLYHTNDKSALDYLNAQNDFKKATTEVARLKQQLDIYGASPTTVDGLYHVTAPIDGYIVEKNVNEGIDIRQDNSSSIFTVSSLSSVWLMVSVFEKDVSQVSVGEPVSITTVAFPDTVFSGKIDQIGNLLDPVSRTLSVRVVLNNEKNLLKPEMFATVAVKIVNQDKVISIPTSALVFFNNDFYVMVRQDQKKFRMKKVKFIRTVNGHSYVGDINPGEIIVSKGALLVANNANFKE